MIGHRSLEDAKWVAGDKTQWPQFVQAATVAYSAHPPLPLLEATECLHGSRLISRNSRFVTDLDPKGWQPPTVAKDELLDNWLAHHTPLGPKNASDR